MRLTLSMFAILLTLSTAARAADEEMKPIFNGKDLSGWKVPAENPWWSVSPDGTLVGKEDEKQKGHILTTEKTYKDVLFEGEAKWSGEIDSGFFFRKPDLQVQIGVSRSLKKDMTASIYAGGGYPGKAEGVDKLLKVGEWNHFKVEVKGNTFKVWLNGQHVLTYESEKHPNPGPIGLQIHGGVKMKVEFRNLRVKEL
jgi:hypothetical protein